MKDFVPDIDATIVSRALEAGAKIIGKNMMRGFLGDFDPPLNPHNPAVSTAGSSSGSAVAVAAGEVDISFGGDQGGSIRVPAAFCGTVGLKPTFGLVSHFGVGFGFEPSLDHVGPMGLTVQDVAAALQAVAGPDGLDPRQHRLLPPEMDVLGRLQEGVRGVRIGVLEQGFSQPIEPDVADSVRAAIDVLADAGAVVTSVSVPEHLRIGELYTALAIEGSKAIADTGFFGMGARTYYPQSTMAAVDRMWREYGDMYPPDVKLDRIAGAFLRRAYSGTIYAKAQNARPHFVKAYDRALSDVDVLALPTVRKVAPRLEVNIHPCDLGDA